MEISEKMRKVELLSTRDCEASYTPAHGIYWTYCIWIINIGLVA